MSLSAFATPPLGKTERDCEAQRRVTVWAGWEVVALCKGGEGRADRPEEVCTFVLSVSIGIPTENSLPDSCTALTKGRTDGVPGRCTHTTPAQPPATS